MKVDGDRLVITIDLSKEFGESKTGKSITIASTDGERLGAGAGGDQDRGECVSKEVRGAWALGHAAGLFTGPAQVTGWPFTYFTMSRAEQDIWTEMPHEA